MSGNSEQPRGENTKSASTVSQSRRTLLMASAAAPLVATLHSGAAMATSSALQCIGGDFSNKKFVENGNSINGDTAVRVAVAYFKRTGSKHTPGYKHFPNDIYVINEICYHNSGKIVANCSTAKLRDSRSPYTESVAYVLVLVDEYGQELGPWPQVQLVEDGGYGHAITQSCWNSLVNSQYSHL